MRGATAPLFLQENLFEERDGARVVRLPEPEHRLLAHLGIAVRARDLHQLRHAFVFRQLAEREDRFLLHLGVGIVLDRAGDRRKRLPAGLPTRSRRSPVSGEAATSVVSHATLSSGFTSVSQTIGIPPASTSQSGVKVRRRTTAPPSRRASTRNSVAGSSAMRVPLRSRTSPVLIDTPLPLSRRHMPAENVESEIVS